MHRILYVQPAGEKGGMEANLLGEVLHLNGSSFSPIVACLEDGPFVGELMANGVSTVLIPRGRLRWLHRTFLTFVKLARLIMRAEIDLVVCENALAGLYGRPAAIVTGRQCILRMGGVGQPPDSVERLAYRLPAQRYIANSHFTRQELIRVGVSKARIAVVHRGVDLQRFGQDNDRARVRVELNLPDRVRVVTAVGRLQRGKGQHVLLKAASLVLVEDPDVRFLIIGAALFGLETAYQKELQDLAQKLRLSSNVIFAGFRNDIPAILSVSDVVVVPSITPEGFGMATVEGMAAGKAVVATGIGATNEIIEDGKTGLLVPPDSPRALAEALLRLLRNEKERRALGERARDAVRSRFSVQAAVRAYERIYTNSLARRPWGAGN